MQVTHFIYFYLILAVFDLSGLFMIRIFQFYYFHFFGLNFQF